MPLASDTSAKTMPSGGSVTSPSLTSTITTLPPSFSTERIQVTATTNGWFTTTRDSQTTILPVIWCRDCGNSGGSSILLWNLPVDLTGTLIDLSRLLPGLPKLSFSCIKVFGVTIGDCAGAKNEKESHDDHDEQNSSSSVVTSTPSSTTGTSTGSCTQATVSDCRVGCSVSYLSGGSSRTTLCYTTSCVSTVGCSVRATTTTTIFTASSSRKGITQRPSPYNIGATWSSLSQDTALWYLGAMISWTEGETNTTGTMQFVGTATASITTLAGASSPTFNSTFTPVRSTTNMPERTSSSTNFPASTTVAEEAPPWCYIHGDSSGVYYCQCGDGSNVVTSPVVGGAYPYTSHSSTRSSISTTESPSSTSATTTQTVDLVTSAPSPSATPACDTEFTVYFAKYVVIRGMNWDNSINNGDVLSAALTKCSGNKIEDWKLSGPPNDFSASGTMKNVEDCFDQAVLEAGGCRVGGSKQ